MHVDVVCGSSKHSRKRRKLRCLFDFVEKFGKFCPENTSIINSNEHARNSHDRMIVSCDVLRI